MIKLLLVFALTVAIASAALPIIRQNISPSISANPGNVVPIIRSVSDIAPDGNYQYAYETGNGISAEETGTLVGSGSDAAINAKGSFQYTSPEGVVVAISYLADAAGFQPVGDSIPTPPPIPAAIVRSLEYNAAHPEPSTPAY